MTTPPSPFKKETLWKSKKLSLTLLTLSLSLCALGFIPLYGIISILLGILLFLPTLIICICQKNVWKSIIACTAPILFILVIPFQIVQTVQFGMGIIDEIGEEMLTKGEIIPQEKLEQAIFLLSILQADAQILEVKKLQQVLDAAQQSRSMALQLGASEEEALEQMRLTIKQKIKQNDSPSPCPSGCSVHKH